MGKHVEFETYALRDQYAARIGISGRDDGINLDSTINSSTHVHVFTDPAKLDALAKAITDAAAALRKSQVLTFADLKPGEWFRKVVPGWTCETLRKRGDERAEVVQGRTYSLVPVEAHEPVQRLTATFAPADEVGK